MPTVGATPGVLIPSGNLITPGGYPGPSGANAWTLTDEQFTVPAVGATATVDVADARWIAIGEYVWLAGAGSGGNAAVLRVTAISGNTVTLLNPESAELIAANLISSDPENLLHPGTDGLLYVPSPASGAYAANAFWTTPWTLTVAGTEFMAGQGVTITPNSSGVLIAIASCIIASTNLASANTRYGTGTPPATSTPATGNLASPNTGGAANAGNGVWVPASWVDILHVTIGTTYWFDLSALVAGPPGAASYQWGKLQVVEL